MFFDYNNLYFISRLRIYCIKIGVVTTLYIHIINPSFIEVGSVHFFKNCLNIDNTMPFIFRLEYKKKNRIMNHLKYYVRVNNSVAATSSGIFSTILKAEQITKFLKIVSVLFQQLYNKSYCNKI